MIAKMLLMCSVCVFAADDKPKDEKAKKDQDAIQGTWKVVSLEQAGQKNEFGEDAELLIVITKDKYVVKQNGNVIEEGTLKLDPEKKPKTIDFAIEKGNDKDKKQPGVYSLDGDNLRLCLTQPGKDDRPKELATKEGSEHMLFTAKREKK